MGFHSHRKEEWTALELQEHLLPGPRPPGVITLLALLLQVGGHRENQGPKSETF